jgi:hypothetical protein
MLGKLWTVACTGTEGSFDPKRTLLRQLRALEVLFRVSWLDSTDSIVLPLCSQLHYRVIALLAFVSELLVHTTLSSPCTVTFLALTLCFPGGRKAESEGEAIIVPFTPLYN